MSPVTVRKKQKLQNKHLYYFLLCMLWASPSMGMHCYGEDVGTYKPEQKKQKPQSLYNYCGLTGRFAQPNARDPKAIIVAKVLHEKQFWHTNGYVHHTCPVKVVKYNSDGTRLAAIADKTVLLTDGALKRIATIRGKATPSDVVFHPIKPQLLLSVDTQAVVLEFNGSLIKKYPLLTGATKKIAIDPSGNLIGAIGSITKHIIDASTGRTIVHDPDELQPPNSYTDIAFNSAGSNTSAGASASGKFVDIWKTAILTLTSDVQSIAFQPQGQLLATGLKDGNVIVWNMNRERVLTLVPYQEEYGYNSSAVAAVSFDCTGTLLAVTLDRHCVYKQSLTVWNLKGTKVAEIVHDSKINGFCFHPSEQRLALACENNCVKIIQRRTLTFEQMLFHVALKRYVIDCICKHKKPDFPNCLSIKTFTRWMAGLLHIEKESLDDVWNTFAEPVQIQVVRNYVTRAKEIASMEQRISDTKYFQRKKNN